MLYTSCMLHCAKENNGYFQHYLLYGTNVLKKCHMQRRCIFIENSLAPQKKQLAQEVPKWLKIFQSGSKSGSEVF